MKMKTICSTADYENALGEVARLWGAKNGTPEGNQLEALAILIDAYETDHYPFDPPDPIEAIRFRLEQNTSGS